MFFLHSPRHIWHGDKNDGVDLLSTFSESKVLAKPDNEENMKEESTPLHGANSPRHRFNIIRTELPDSTP